MKSSNFDEALQLLKQSDHGININEIIYDEFYPLHLSCAAGELVLDSSFTTFTVLGTHIRINLTRCRCLYADSCNTKPSITFCFTEWA